MKKSHLKNIIRESIKELMTEQQTINGGNCNGKIELPGSNYHQVGEYTGLIFYTLIIVFLQYQIMNVVNIVLIQTG